MADEKMSLHIDDDWKKQAQEEKRKLAEQQQKSAEKPAAPASSPAASSSSQSRTPAGAAKAPGARDVPQASFATLIQSIITQALYYMGDLPSSGSDQVVSLDLAKHHIDTLGIMEDKTQNNLTEEEKTMLDTALYDVRMRFVNIASKYSI